MEQICRVLHAESQVKKAKTLEVKLRSAIRLIWSRSKERRAIIKAAVYDVEGIDMIRCPICDKEWPWQMGEVDHEPPIGPLESWRDVTQFIDKMFFGPQRVICKICHKKKTAAQRRNYR